MKVFCVGLTVVDIPLRPVGRDIFEKDAVTIERPVWAPGGDATNVAMALCRLGMDASLCALTGEDVYGDFIVERLNRSGVDSRPVYRHPQFETGLSYILIEREGERHFMGCYHSINRELSWEHIDEKYIAEADLVFLGSAMCMQALDEGGSAKLFKRAHELGKITASDFCGGADRSGDEWLRLLEPMLNECDILMPSMAEARLLTGETELPLIRRRLSGFGAKLLIVKLGAEGCYLTDFTDEWLVPAFTEFKPVDTTGAGDSFSAGFLRAHLEGWKPEEAALFANVVASYNVTKIGATGGVPDFETAYRYLCDHCGGASRFPLP